jgi:hypothetical protein
VKLPSRWKPYVLDVATRPGPLQSRAEKLVQQDLASHQRHLARTLPRRRKEHAEHLAITGARAAVRAAVFTRAAGRCECGGTEITSRSGHMDHFFGKARSENVETCWALCASCDHDKTENRIPGTNQVSRRWWLERFRRHCILHGYGRALVMVDQQLALEPQESSRAS